MDDTRDDPLLHDLYAGITEPARLDRFLTGLAAASGSHVATLTLQDLATPERSRAYSVGASAAELARYASHAGDNVWVQASLPRLQAGAVLDGDDFVPQQALMESRYYQQFLRTIDVRHSVAMCGAADATTVAMITLSRSGRRGRFDDDDMARLRRLGPHWSNAQALMRALNAARAEGVAGLPLSTGLFLLDASFRWRRGNAAAERLRSCDWWAAGDPARLEPAAPVSRVAWREARRLAAAGPSLTGAHLFPLHARDGSRVALAALHPLPTGGEIAHALLLRPLQPRAPADFEMRLRTLFALTAGEAALAAALHREGELAAAAAALGVGIRGARTRLQAIFSKTDTRRQTELQRLLDAIVDLSS